MQLFGQIAEPVNSVCVCAMYILTIQVLEFVPMKESLSTWVSLLSRKGV